MLRLVLNVAPPVRNEARLQYTLRSFDLVLDVAPRHPTSDIAHQLLYFLLITHGMRVPRASVNPTQKKTKCAGTLGDSLTMRAAGGVVRLERERGRLARNLRRR